MIILLTLCSQAYSGDVNDALVTMIRIDANGKGMIYFDRPIENRPACAAEPAYYNALAFDANIAGGKAILSWALTAKATGSKVWVHGYSTCEIYGNGVVSSFDYGVVK